jgi:hypothetical protein
MSIDMTAYEAKRLGEFLEGINDLRRNTGYYFPDAAYLMREDWNDSLPIMFNHVDKHYTADLK